MKLYTPKHLAKTPMAVKITAGLDENGDHVVVKEVEVKARKQSTNAVVYGTDGQKVNLSLKMFVFEGFESFYVGMQGICTVEGKEYMIATCSQLTNPDGSTNHFVLGLM